MDKFTVKFSFQFLKPIIHALIWINLWTYRREKNSLPLSFSFVFQYIYFFKLGFLKIAVILIDCQVYASNILQVFTIFF